MEQWVPGGCGGACRLLSRGEPDERFLAVAEGVMPDGTRRVAKARLIRRLEMQRLSVAHHVQPHLRIAHRPDPPREGAALELEAEGGHEGLEMPGCGGVICVTIDVLPGVPRKKRDG